MDLETIDEQHRAAALDAVTRTLEAHVGRDGVHLAAGINLIRARA
jgi:tetrahydromethanopterin S-methyltransferase subunit B